MQQASVGLIGLRLWSQIQLEKKLQESQTHSRCRALASRRPEVVFKKLSGRAATIHSDLIGKICDAMVKAD